MTIFVKLPLNSGHLLITDNFLRLIGVRYSEVSLYFSTPPFVVCKINGVPDFIFSFIMKKRKCFAVTDTGRILGDE